MTDRSATAGPAVNRSPCTLSNANTSAQPHSKSTPAYDGATCLNNASWGTPYFAHGQPRSQATFGSGERKSRSDIASLGRDPPRAHTQCCSSTPGVSRPRAQCALGRAVRGCRSVVPSFSPGSRRRPTHHQRLGHAFGYILMAWAALGRAGAPGAVDVVRTQYGDYTHDKPTLE